MLLAKPLKRSSRPTEEMRALATAYAGPICHCPPGAKKPRPRQEPQDDENDSGNFELE